MSKHISAVTPLYERGLKLLALPSAASGPLSLPQLQHGNVRKPGEGHTQRTRQSCSPGMQFTRQGHTLGGENLKHGFISGRRQSINAPVGLGRPVSRSRRELICTCGGETANNGNVDVGILTHV